MHGSIVGSGALQQFSGTCTRDDWFAHFDWLTPIRRSCFAVPQCGRASAEYRLVWTV
jgi:hypothetical protein